MCSILCELTLMLAWNTVEAGKILETYKLYENKPPDMIMEKTGTMVRAHSYSALYPHSGSCWIRNFIQNAGPDPVPGA